MSSIIYQKDGDKIWTLPWGPIMAFLTFSPLMSPDGFIMLVGIIGVKFTTALLIASIIISLGSGYLTHLIDTKTDFLKNQTRFSTNAQVQACTCSESAPAPVQTCGCSAPAPTPAPVQTCGCSGAVTVSGEKNRVRKEPNSLSRLYKKIKLYEMAEALLNVGLKLSIMVIFQALKVRGHIT